MLFMNKQTNKQTNEQTQTPELKTLKGTVHVRWGGNKNKVWKSEYDTNTARHGTARHGTARHGTAQHSTAQYSS